MFTFTPDAHLFSFAVPFDAGYTPFVADGIASFALSQPQIRACAQCGDVLLGLTADNAQVRVVFVFLVDETLSWEAYSKRTREERQRIPHNVLDAADAIYPPASRQPLPSWSGHTAADYERDIVEGQNVLLSRRFWYFGKGSKVPMLLPEALHVLLPSGGFRKQVNDTLRQDFAKTFNNLLNAASAQAYGVYDQPQYQPELEGFNFIMSCSTLSASADGCGAQVEGRVPLDVLRDAERNNDVIGERLN
ncbi:MAG: hypothetical protein Q4A74_07330 [Cardiobacteriaceae bacterium]|nr:hypothetical protein [Cardiobacteriaceae bacterium]